MIFSLLMTVMKKDYFLFSLYKKSFFFLCLCEALFKIIVIYIWLWIPYFFIWDILKGFSVFPKIWVSYSWSIFPFSSISLLYMHRHTNPARSEFCNFALAEHLTTNGFIVVEQKSWYLAVQICRTMAFYFWFVQSWANYSCQGICKSSTGL